MINWGDVFDYRDGDLFWKIKPSNVAKTGDRAGTLMPDGYRRVQFKRKTYPQHRIIYEMHFGPIPKGMQIDHVDLNKSNNRIENLRMATPAQNRANNPVQERSYSGRKGVVWEKNSKKWRAAIYIKGKYTSLGYFDCPDAAGDAYDKKAKEHYGEFARTTP